MSEIIRKSKFEKDFIEHTYSSIVSDISIAFSELVANSQDAGATTVSITLPDKKGNFVIIEDNGTGMTDKEFQQRWMVIAYNRVAHQGEYVEYISSKGKAKRLAYGRSGVGRHSMLCFDDHYQVETWRDGKEDYGEVYAYTCLQLVQTVGKRLFNLKDKLTVLYQELSTKDYLAEILGEPRQTELDMAQ